MNASSTVRLHKCNRGFYSWSNGESVRSDRYLSANIYRDSDNSSKWVIRYFVDSESAYVEVDIWTLRMARGILARVAATYYPSNDTSVWLRSRQVRNLSFEGWKAAADDEIALISAQVSDD